MKNTQYDFFYIKIKSKYSSVPADVESFERVISLQMLLKNIILGWLRLRIREALVIHIIDKLASSENSPD